MGRKRDQGKARRKAAEEAKAKAHQERFNKALGEEMEHNEEFRRWLLTGETGCTHGFDKIDNDFAGKPLPGKNTFIVQFAEAFKVAYEDADCADVEEEHGLLHYLEAAKDATMDEFANVWHDADKINMAISHLLSEGTKDILDSDEKAKADREYCFYQWGASMNMTCVRYLEEYVAVHLKGTKATYNVAKLLESNSVDEHTLVKFFRKRIPCSCLDEKYEEVKHITKMGICHNEECEYGTTFSSRRVDRNKTKYCSRCRCVAYCCRECQEADWPEHKTDCDMYAATIAKFEAKQQNCC